ncbi:MAG: TIR domain-containing protein [Candidatus Latescibacterota bacterium]
MNVTVLGSYRSEDEGPWPLRNEDKFSALCELLGEKLAQSSHFLTVPRDDDMQSADWHCLRGFRKVNRSPLCYAVSAGPGPGGVTSTKGHIDAATDTQCVIVLGGANGTYAAGMTAIYRRTLVLPIACFGGAAEEILNALKLPHNHVLRTAMFCGTTGPCDIEGMVDALIAELDGHPRLLTVRGRSSDKGVVRELLWEEFPNLHGPEILDYSGTSAVGLANKFSTLAGTATGAVVIATPDDIGTSVLDGQGKPLDPAQIMKFAPRARENVWLEMGWLWAVLGRDRILLLVKDETVMPSDIQDAVRVPHLGEPSSVRHRIVEFVEGLRTGQGAAVE